MKVKDPHIKPTYRRENARIEDLQTQVQKLYDQIHTKDEQIEKLNEKMIMKNGNYFGMFTKYENTNNLS